MINEFLIEYAKSLEWTERNLSIIRTKLCEEYHYSSRYNLGFLQIALGYFWCKTGNYVEATGSVALLKFEMDKVYEEVAKKYNWGE